MIGGYLLPDGSFYEAKWRENLEIFDRVAAAILRLGSSMASQRRAAMGGGVCAAHGALAMTTPEIQPW